MQLIINDLEFNFKKSAVKEFDTEWASTVHYNKYELGFTFNESLFLDKQSNTIVIDWELIEEFASHVLQNLETIQLKGSLVLEELYRQVFGEESLFRDKGYFLVGGIELKSFRKKLFEKNLLGDFPLIRYYFEYEIYYFLESDIHGMLDPYHSYFARFSNHNNLNIIGVSRIG